MLPRPPTRPSPSPLRGRAALCLLLCACQRGAEDRAPGELIALGLHRSATYVARRVRGERPFLVHPRRGQPAIRKPGETFDVAWVGSLGASLRLAGDAPEISLGVAECDAEGLCHARATAPSRTGLHGLCIVEGAAEHCSGAALSVVPDYDDAPRVVQLTDVHVGRSDGERNFRRVIDALNALSPPPSLVVITGDCTHGGQGAQRAAFLEALDRLALPSLVLAGNHDFKDGGLEGFLRDVNPELDGEISYGRLRVLFIATGQLEANGLRSEGPDPSQVAWLGQALAAPGEIALALHNPLFGAWGTVGDARGEMLDLLDGARPRVRSVWAGHTHVAMVHDGDGVQGGLDPDQGELPRGRWPLHYVSDKSTEGRPGYAIHELRRDDVRWAWIVVE